MPNSTTAALAGDGLTFTLSVTIFCKREVLATEEFYTVIDVQMSYSL